MRHLSGRALLFAACLLVPSLRAQVTVNSFLDLPDADLEDGVPDFDLGTDGQQISLRAAIQQANFNGGSAVILVPSGTYRLTIKGADENEAATGDLDIATDITIEGDGAASTVIDAHKLKDRIFEVHAGSVEISGLTLLKGKAPVNETGGGLRNHGGSVDFHDCVIERCRSGHDAGGFDTRLGFSALTDVLIDHCQSKFDGGGMGADGGNAMLTRVTFAHNHAGGVGGGFENFGQEVDAVNCTLFANSAKRGGGLSLAGGAFQTLINCTLARNKAGKGSGVATDDATEGLNACFAQNVIFANKPKTNCIGPLDSLGGNIDTGTSCGFGEDEQSATDPQLLKLADNGGSTPTVAIKPTSPAIDAGVDIGAPAADQRGQARVDLPDVGISITDCGSYEFVPGG